MARLFRLWEKKRGERRTGSRLAGSVGEAAFFGSLFLLASVTLAVMLTNQFMQPHPEFFTLGVGKWLALLVLVSLILIGGGGVILTVLEVQASAERRSALVRRARNLDLIREARGRAHDFPNIPRDANLTNSPGVKLAFRLPSLESTAWQLSFAAATCLLCVGTASVLVPFAVRSYQHGTSALAITAFLIPFSSVTAWTIYYFVRQLVLHTGMGTTSIEISEHPLYPGGKYSIYLNQGGRLNVVRLAFTLICEEEATFRQGTDIRTERRIVYCEGLFDRENFRIEDAAPFEYQGEFAIPESAMHSFLSAHNAVHWKIVVCGDFAKWPTMIRSYPIVVYPPQDSELPVPSLAQSSDTSSAEA